MECGRVYNRPSATAGYGATVNTSLSIEYCPPSRRTPAPVVTTPWLWAALYLTLTVPATVPLRLAQTTVMGAQQAQARRGLAPRCHDAGATCSLRTAGTAIAPRRSTSPCDARRVAAVSVETTTSRPPHPGRARTTGDGHQLPRWALPLRRCNSSRHAPPATREWQPRRTPRTAADTQPPSQL